MYRVFGGYCLIEKAIYNEGRTIKEGIYETLKRVNCPLSGKEIYAYIIEHDLYRFNAEKPPNIVLREIRRHCEKIDFLTAKKEKLFKILKMGDVG